MHDNRLRVNGLAAIVVIWLIAAVPAFAQNLVVNGGFESGATGWTGGTVTTDNPRGDGTYCLRVADSDIRRSISASSGLIPIERSARYLLRGWVRGQTTPQNVLVTVSQYDAQERHIRGANWDFRYTVGTDWSLYRNLIEGFQPNATQIRISLQPTVWTPGGENTGTAWFDDVGFFLYSGNLIPNGDFEASGSWYGTGSLVAGAGRGGGVALEIEDDRTDASLAANSEAIPVVTGAPYFLQAWVRGEAPEQRAWVTIDQFDANGAWIPRNNIDFPIEVGLNWTRLAVVIPNLHPNTDTVQVFLHPVPYTNDGGLTGRAWFDDIRLQFYGGNLVENGGFEAGLGGWSGGGISTTAHRGTASLLLEDRSTSSNVRAGTTTPIPVVRGASYLFEAWHRKPVAGQDVWLAINQFDENGTWIRNHNIDFIIPAGTQWSVFRQLLPELAPQAASIGINFYPVRWTPGGERTGQAWFDDVSLRLFDGDLLPNGDFDRGTEGWDGGRRDADVFHAGSGSLLVEDLDTHANVAASSGLLPILPGVPTSFSAWVRSDRDQQVLLALGQYDAGGQRIPGENMDFVIDATTTWSCFQRVIRDFHPDATAVRVSLYATRWTADGSRTGRAWFDQVRVVPEKRDVVGAWLQAPSGEVGAWWSPAAQKIRRHFQLDPGAGNMTEVSLSAARGESEPFQIVLVPERNATIANIVVSDLVSAIGTIPAAQVNVREVAYVPIDVPTDRRAVVCCEMPDPLPALQLPINLEAGAQQPLWVTVQVPDGTRAEAYRGTVTIELTGAADIVIPLRVLVRDFAMPAEHHIQTAYGLDLGLLDRYHNLNRDRTARREVFRLYLDDFAAHRISPLNPIGDDSYIVHFPNWNWANANLVVDPADPANTVAEVADNDPSQSVIASGTELIPIDRRRTYTLQWRARIGGNRPAGEDDYWVLIQQFDTNGDQIEGANHEFLGHGDGTWRTETRTVNPALFHASATSVGIVLFGRPWTEPGNLVGTTWFDDVVFSPVGGTNNLVVNPGFDILRAEDVIVNVDFTRFDAAATYAFDTLGFDSFRLHLPHFPSGSMAGGFTTPRLLNFDWGTPEYEIVFGRVLRAINDYLEARGWLDRAYAYWADEAQPANIPLVRQGMEILHRADPRLRRLITLNYDFDDQLVGAVDIWTPQLDNYWPGFAAERRAAGDETWWYVSTGNRAPYPNNFIDYSALDVRIRFWMAWRYGVQGSLYWFTNYWNPDTCAHPGCQDPWTDAESYTPDGERFGNGDGRLVYPPQNFADGTERRVGPVASIRWELIRDGIEDYEYLWMLDDATRRLRNRVGRTPLVRRAEALLVVPDNIVESLEFRTDDPLLIDARREEIADVLEDVLHSLPPPSPTASAPPKKRLRP